MPIRKRGFQKGNGFYFKGNRIVLESTKSKVAFFGILFLFGVVIVLTGMDVYEFYFLGFSIHLDYLLFLVLHH